MVLSCQHRTGNKNRKQNKITTKYLKYHQKIPPAYRVQSGDVSSQRAPRIHPAVRIYGEIARCRELPHYPINKDPPRARIGRSEIDDRSRLVDRLIFTDRHGQDAASGELRGDLVVGDLDLDCCSRATWRNAIVDRDHRKLGHQR